MVAHLPLALWPLISRAFLSSSSPPPTNKTLELFYEHEYEYVHQYEYVYEHQYEYEHEYEYEYEQQTCQWESY